MALSAEQLKAAFAKRASGTSSGSENTGFWEKFFPFYRMNFGDVAHFRFLPDLDENNPLGFVVENKYHELIINGKKKKLACLSMYGEECPCCQMSRDYYDQGDEKTGKAFWRKLEHIAQGLVVNSPFDYPIKAEENPVRLISVGTKLYKKIEAAIVSGEFDEPFYDLVNGCDFKIMKTPQGEYADYSNSEFARRATPVAESALTHMKLYNLNDYRYAKVEREAMEAQIQAFLNGRTYEESKPAVAPAPAAQPALKDDVPVISKAAPAPAAEPEADAPAAAPAASGSSRANEILARLRKQG